MSIAVLFVGTEKGKQSKYPSGGQLNKIQHIQCKYYWAVTGTEGTTHYTWVDFV